MRVVFDTERVVVFRNKKIVIGKNGDFSYVENSISRKLELIISHVAQNIAERYHKSFQYFIAIEILSQHFCQILQNISSQHYNLNFQEYLKKKKKLILLEIL